MLSTTYTRGICAAAAMTWFRSCDGVLTETLSSRSPEVPEEEEEEEEAVDGSIHRRSARSLGSPIFHFFLAHSCEHDAGGVVWEVPVIAGLYSLSRFFFDRSLSSLTSALSVLQRATTPFGSSRGDYVHNERGDKETENPGEVYKGREIGREVVDWS